MDIEGFGDRRRTNPHQVAVRDGLYQVLQQALLGAGIRPADWHHEDRGDGVFILAAPDVVKGRFVEVLPAKLVEALHEHNQAHPIEEQIRLRVALHAGEVNYDDHGVTAASINLAFRLLDAREAKAALAASPGVLVLIASSWFFDEVIRHSPAGRSDTYRPMAVKVKETSTVAWIACPDHPSRPSRATEILVPTTMGFDREVDDLAETIHRQWTDEAASRMLHRPEPLRLQWLTTARAVAAQPAAVLAGTVGGRPVRLRLHGRLDEIVGAFTRLPNRQLVVLGEPGAGKTALAILLTLGLLERKRRHGGPVPVLLSAASWNPNHQDVHAWVARRLVEDYPALARVDATGRRIAERLVASQTVLPILDGLDEMSVALRPAAIEALDRSMPGGRPFVLTSRSVEYQAAVTSGGSVLARAAVVEIEPVAVTDAITFLSAGTLPGDTRWEPVYHRLRGQPGHPLASALSTPLMVWLARTTYADPASNPAELADTTRFPHRVAIEEHLLEMLIPAVYRVKPPSLLPGKTTAKQIHYPPEDARRWLTFLATHLDHLGTRDLAWWQLHQAVPRALTNSIYGLVVGLLTGFGIGFGGFAAGLLPDFTAVLLTVLGTGSVPGVISALVTGRAWRSQHSPGLTNIRVRGRFDQLTGKLRDRLVFGLLIGVVITLTTTPVVGLPTGVAFGIDGGLFAMIAAGISDWLKAPVDELRSPSPAAVLHSDRTMSRTRGIAQGCCLSIGVGIIVGYTFGFDAGLVVGLISAVAGMLSGGLDTAWGLYVIVRGWLALQGKMPLRLMRFLDDAHKRGLLRQAGAVYQFRHARLQDHLVHANRRNWTAMRLPGTSSCSLPIRRAHYRQMTGR
ncbi:MAG: NACHT domain-containing protein [Labedaea sp.]